MTKKFRYSTCQSVFYMNHTQGEINGDSGLLSIVSDEFGTHVVDYALLNKVFNAEPDLIDMSSTKIGEKQTSPRERPIAGKEPVSYDPAMFEESLEDNDESNSNIAVMDNGLTERFPFKSPLTSRRSQPGRAEFNTSQAEKYPARFNRAEKCSDSSSFDDDHHSNFEIEEEEDKDSMSVDDESVDPDSTRSNHVVLVTQEMAGRPKETPTVNDRRKRPREIDVSLDPDSSSLFCSLLLDLSETERERLFVTYRHFFYGSSDVNVLKCGGEESILRFVREAPIAYVLRIFATLLKQRFRALEGGFKDASLEHEKQLSSLSETIKDLESKVVWKDLRLDQLRTDSSRDASALKARLESCNRKNAAFKENEERMQQHLSDVKAELKEVTDANSDFTVKFATISKSYEQRKRVCVRLVKEVLQEGQVDSSIISTVVDHITHM